MQAHVSRRRRLVSASLSFVIATTPILQAADIPVKQIILYKHGIGYFERQGVIPAGEEGRLDFKNTDMNDILKSLVVTDSSGGRVAGVRYDSNETLEQRLDRFPFKIGEQEFVSSFLDHLKGARIELKLAGRPVTGAILSARPIATDKNGESRLVREQVTILPDSGDITNYDLSDVTSLRLADPHLQEQLKQYLQTLAQSKSREKRSVYIDSAGLGERNLHISYITPTAIWKSSYRLSLADQNSTLEGWAIVDNTTDEDWNGVKLAVVSGRPISFISLLDTPRYGKRQVAELPEDRAAGPVVYGGSVEVAAAPGAGIAGAVGSGVPLAGKQFQRADGTHLGSGGAPGIGRVEEYAMLQAPSSSVEGAAGSALGELFEYSFAAPVTIKKNQSAMLPFLQDKIAARKLLIYTERDGEHPVNAAEITNTTSKTLDGGPLVVYESGAYAGEALFETLKAADKRLIGYGVDYGTRITTAFDSTHRDVRELHASHGILRLHYSEHQTRTYTMRNIDAKPKVLMVQQEGVDQYSVLSPKPTERTATAYRFEVKLPANGSQTLKVEQERLYVDTTAVAGSAPDFLLTVIQNKEISDRARKQLQTVIDLRTRLADVDRNLDLAKTQSSDLTNDQTRLRQNIDSLNRVKGQEDQVRKYAGQLSDNEARLATLRDQQRDLTTRRASLDSDVKNAIDQLDF